MDPDGSVSHSGVCRMHSEVRMGTGQTDFQLPVQQAVDELEKSSMAVYRGRKVNLNHSALWMLTGPR